MTIETNTVELNDTDLDEAAGGRRVLMRLKNAGVMRDSVSTESADPLPSEEVTLGYTEVEWTY